MKNKTVSEPTYMKLVEVYNHVFVIMLLLYEINSIISNIGNKISFLNSFLAIYYRIF